MRAQVVNAPSLPDGTQQALLSFNLYRVVLGLLLLTLLVAGWTPQPLALADTKHFVVLALIYLALTLAAVAITYYYKPLPALMGGAGVVVDVLLLGAMHYYSGGVGSGFGVLILVSVAGHSILAGGGIVFFYAAVATLAVLGVEAYLYLVHLPVFANFSFAGFFSLSLFVIAYGCKLLAARLTHSEALVRHRSQELRNLAQLNEQIVGMMQAGVVVIDDDDRVALINQAARRILGRTGNDRGRLLREVSPDLSRLLSYFACAVPGTPDVAHLQLGEREYQVTGLRQGTAARGSLLVLEESSTVRARALELKRAALGRLAAGISHELRNPLAAITQATQLLSDATQLPEQARQLTRVIHRQGQRMNRIVENVLQLSRDRRPRQEMLLLKEWLAEFKQEFLEMHHLDAAEVRLSVRPATLAIYVDPTQLHQVLWNLGENALRYSVRSPRLSLRAGQEPLASQPYLDVIDCGTGIDAEHSRRLFEPFFTTEPEGSGLGLYLANELCETNHALLSLHRNSARGCCFRISFVMPLPGQPLAEEVGYARTGC